MTEIHRAGAAPSPDAARAIDTDVRDVEVQLGPMELESGEQLPAVVQRVTIYDACHPERSEAARGAAERSRGSAVRTALVAHALTGSSRIAEWWPRMLAPGGYLDTSHWRVVGINALGGCYGSSAVPSGRVTVRDIVRAQHRALERLGIEKLDLVIGGSLGGMQGLQWAVDFPESVGRAVVIGAHDHHSAMGIALNALQREALELDPKRGLRLARKIAMLTYKSEELLSERHGRRPDRHGVDRFDVEGYLEHQADLFERRMDAHAYATLTRAMDSFDVRNEPAPRGPELLFIGISSDWLFRPQDVRAAAQRLAGLGADARYAELQSEHGHDAFLAGPEHVGAIIRST